MSVTRSGDHRNVKVRLRQFERNDALAGNRRRSRCRENAEFAFATHNLLPSAVAYGVLRASRSAQIAEANRTNERRRVGSALRRRNVGRSPANASRRRDPYSIEPRVL